MYFQKEALDWHSIWISSGRPDNEFVYNMRCATRKLYHKQANYVIKSEKQLKLEKLAARYIDSRSPKFWKDLAKLRGTGKKPSSNVSGVSDSKGIANLFTDYYSEIYNSVSFDDEDMQSLYNTVCERVNCTSTDHCHNIDYSSVKYSISK